MKCDLGGGGKEAGVVVGLGDLRQLEGKGSGWVKIIKVKETESREMSFSSLVIGGLVGAGLGDEQGNGIDWQRTLDKCQQNQQMRAGVRRGATRREAGRAGRKQCSGQGP